jgi:hypothetical protein
LIGRLPGDLRRRLRDGKQHRVYRQTFKHHGANVPQHPNSLVSGLLVTGRGRSRRSAHHQTG